MSDASPFVITELSGDKRTVRLTGRGLPYRPYTLKTTQRVEVDWLPGSPEGTATILGSTEAPSQIQGMWKDKYLGISLSTLAEQPAISLNNERVVDVQSAVDLFDSIVRFAQMLEVKWLNTTRRGFLIGFEKRFMTTHDVEWTMEFEWINRGEDLGPAVFIATSSVGDVSGVMSQLLDQLDNIETPTNFGVNGNFLSGLQELQHNIEDLIFKIEDSVQQLTDKITTPIRAIRGIIATLKGVENEAGLMFDYVQGQFGDALGLKSTGVNGSGGGGINAEKSQAEQSYAEKLEAQRFIYETKLWAKALAQQAVSHRTQLTLQIGEDLLGTYVAREGEDLRDVSQIFYQTPFEWKRIMIFNDMTSAELAAGQIVYVPKINPQEGSQQLPGI